LAENQTLLIAPKPYPDESFSGYILRLTELNFYEELSHIYLLSGLWLSVQRRSKNGNLIDPFKDDLSLLSNLTNCTINELIKLTFASDKVGFSSLFHLNNQPLPRQAIHTKKQKYVLNV
jgi:TniQ